MARKKPTDAPKSDVPAKDRATSQQKPRKEVKQTAAAVAASERLKIDPIVKVSFIVFMLACLVVVGATVNEKMFADKSGATVVYGEKVYVQYTGSLFGYYDEEGAVIFDTNMKDVYENEAFLKVASLDRATFDDLSFDATDKPGVLLKFRDAVMNKRVGDTVKVKINAADGYNSDDGQNEKTLDQAGTMARVMTSLDEKAVKKIIKDSIPSDCVNLTMKTVFGWNAIVNKADSLYTVTHIPEAGKDYDYNDYLKVKVATVDANVQYSYELTEKGTKAITDKVGITADFGDGEVFIHKVEGGKIHYRDKAVNGQTLYFVIKIVKVGEDKKN